MIEAEAKWPTINRLSKKDNKKYIFSEEEH